MKKKIYKGKVKIKKGNLKKLIVPAVSEDEKVKNAELIINLENKELDTRTKRKYML